MAEAAITVVSGREELPLRLAPGERLCLITVTAGNLTPAETASSGPALLRQQVARRHEELVSAEFAYGAAGARGAPGVTATGVTATGVTANGDTATGVTATAPGAHGEAPSVDLLDPVEAALAASNGATAVVLATIDAASDPGQQRLFAGLLERGQRPIVLALRSPADAAVLSGARAVVCSYGRREDQTEAAVAVLFGERPAPGRLPIDLESLVASRAGQEVTV